MGGHHRDTDYSTEEHRSTFWVTEVTYEFPDLFICKTILFVFSSGPNIFGFVLVEQIFTDLAYSKLKFDFGATPTTQENEGFRQRDLGPVYMIPVYRDLGL